MAAPVVQHLGNMVNLLRRLRAPENEIIVLGPIKLLPEPSHLFQQIHPHHKQMADIIHAGQKIRVEIRLEMRVEQRLPVHVQLVLVRIDHLCARPLVNRLHHLVQRMRRQRVVVVRKHQKIPPRHIHGRVGISRDPLIFPQNLVTNP